MTETKIEALGPVTIHKFELAGLGKAPFRCVGFSQNVFQPDPFTPAKGGGTCDYCGNGIMNEFHVKSADGRTFKVGCDCIAKVGDEGLKRLADKNPDYRRLLRDQRAAAAQRKAQKVNAVFAVLVFENAELLASRPHPMGFSDRTTGRTLTMLDWAFWMAHHCGRSGLAGVTKRLAQVVAGAA